MNLELQSLQRFANRVHVAIHDIGEAEEFAKTFRSIRGTPESEHSPQNDHLEAALGMAAIISYARPFVASRSNGIADKLIKPDDIQLFEGHPEHAAEHQLVMTLRDQVVAHSDWTHRFSLVEVPDQFSESQRLLVAFDPRLLLTNFHSFIDLAQHVRIRLVILIMSLEGQMNALARSG